MAGIRFAPVIFLFSVCRFEPDMCLFSVNLTCFGRVLTSINRFMLSIAIEIFYLDRFLLC